MAVFDMDEVNAGRQPWVPARVFDANGLEWKHVVRIDTVTGELTHYVGHDTGKPVRETIHVAAPVIVVPIT